MILVRAEAERNIKSAAANKEFFHSLSKPWIKQFSLFAVPEYLYSFLFADSFSDIFPVTCHE